MESLRLDAEELDAWLRLTETPEVGRESARRLLAAFGSPQAVIAAGTAQRREVVKPRAAQALAEAGETKPRCLRVWGAPATELAETEVELSPEDTPIEPLALFSSSYQPATVLNLLQGGYSRQAH